MDFENPHAVPWLRARRKKMKAKLEIVALCTVAFIIGMLFLAIPVLFLK
jgi:hypothetical protein